MEVARSLTAPVAGELLRLIRRGEAITRSDLVRLSGLSRPTVTARVAALLDAGFITSGEAPAARGRPPEALAFNSAGGYLLAADIGGTHTRVAITDLSANVLDERETDIDVTLGPDAVLGWVVAAFNRLLLARSASAEDVHGIGVGVPGPVDTAGSLVSPPIMRGWDGVSVPAFFAADFPVPTVVDRDINIIALGEHRRSWPTHDNLVVVKVGLGIGLGIVVGGELYRGELGAAGELGHIQRGGEELCRCGKTGCLEAVAGGWAIMQALKADGRDVRTSSDIVTLIQRGDRGAWRMVQEAGALLGEALADVVALFNPAVLVIGGNLAEAQDALLPGVREAVYRRSQPLATRDLLIATSRLGSRAGTIGAGMLAHEHLFSPHMVSDLLGM